MARELTEKQKLFLEYLFDEGVDGDYYKAKILAGYSETTPITQIVNALKDEIIEYTKSYIARNAPKAAVGLSGLITNPAQMGGKIKLAAASQILDRAGVVKTEKVEVTQSGFYLPPKDSE